MKQTHSRVIISSDGKVVAFIDGIPDKCKHAFDDSAFTLGNGNIILEKTVRCPTNEATQEYIAKIAEERNTFISGMTSVCIKCGKVYNPLSDPDLMNI